MSTANGKEVAETMVDANQNRRGHAAKQDALDRDLSVALAKYSAVEPRPGLEERILTNLRAEHNRIADRSLWWWRVGIAVAAVVLITVALAWRATRPSEPAATNHSSPAAHSSRQPAAENIGSDSGSNVRPPDGRPRRRTTGQRPQPTNVEGAIVEGTMQMAAIPKLDQFPSPHPLNEQEKILMSYVSEYPKQAVLIARARAEALREDEAEEEKRESGIGNRDLQQRN